QAIQDDRRDCRVNSIDDLQFNDLRSDLDLIHCSDPPRANRSNHQTTASPKSNDAAAPRETGAVATGAMAATPAPPAGTGGLKRGGTVKLTVETVVAGVAPVVKLQTK